MTNTLLIGQIYEGKYELLGRLGSGGIGTVYKALQLDCKRVVALKILHKNYSVDEEFKTRFLREAQTLNKLSHANIVNVYHLACSSEGDLFIAMEFIEGRSLQNILDDGGKLPVLEAVRITRELASALSHVHAHNIIHRDLKPANIILTDAPQKNTAKIIDFGLARIEETKEQKLTRTGELVGTPHYMSPEQCKGLKVSEASDIYSLTLCFFEMLTGRRPFEADNSVGLMYKHLNESVPNLKPSELDCFDEGINKIIQTGMSKSPEDRFSNMDDYATALADLTTVLERKNVNGPRTKRSKNSFLIPALSVLCVAIFAFIYFFANKFHQSTGTRSEQSSEHKSGDLASENQNSKDNLQVAELLDQASQSANPIEIAILMTQADQLSKKNGTKVSLDNKVAVQVLRCPALRNLGFNKIPLHSMEPVVDEINERFGSAQHLPLSTELCSNYIAMRIEEARLYQNRQSLPDAVNLLNRASSEQAAFMAQGVSFKPVISLDFVDTFGSMGNAKDLEIYLQRPFSSYELSNFSTVCLKHGLDQVANKCLLRAMDQIQKSSTNRREEKLYWLMKEGYCAIGGDRKQSHDFTNEILKNFPRILSEDTKEFSFYMQLAVLFALDLPPEKSIQALKAFSSSRGWGKADKKASEAYANLTKQLAQATSHGDVFSLIHSAVASKVSGFEQLREQIRTSHEAARVRLVASSLLSFRPVTDQIELIYEAAKSTKNAENMFCYSAYCHHLIQRARVKIPRALRLHCARNYAYTLEHLGLSNAALKRYQEIISEYREQGPAPGEGKVPAFDESWILVCLKACSEIFIEKGQLEHWQLERADKLSTIKLGNWQSRLGLRTKVACLLGRASEISQLLDKVTDIDVLGEIALIATRYHCPELANQAVSQGLKVCAPTPINKFRLYLRQAIAALENGDNFEARVSLRKIHDLKIENSPEIKQHLNELHLLALVELLTSLPKESKETLLIYKKLSN